MFYPPCAVKAPPAGRPLLQLPGWAERCLQGPGIRRDALRPGFVLLGRCLEVQAEFDEGARRLRLEFDVRRRVPPRELEDRPHHLALGTGDFGGQAGEGEVFDIEEEFAGLHAAVFRRHCESVPPETAC